jgi:abequosyltransferase
MAKLSICIPTYNRADCLAQLLDSILIQAVDELEVVISDDASPDDTASVAESYRARFKHFTFVKQPKNIGIDRNFLAAVALGTGDYIWLMGDDDCLEPGAVQRVLAALQRWPGVSGLTLGVVDYDATLTVPTGLRVTPATHLIPDVHALFTEIPDLLGFVSALVVERSRWAEVANEAAVARFYNYYVQVYILGRMMARHGQWGVVHEPCVRYRSSNDQFLSALGWLRRLKVDVLAYHDIAWALFPQAPQTRKAMLRRIFDAHIMARIINGKTGHEPIELSKAVVFLFKHYRAVPTYWTRGLPMLVSPPFALRAARKLYKTLSKHSGAARAQQLDLHAPAVAPQHT